MFKNKTQITDFYKSLIKILPVLIVLVLPISGCDEKCNCTNEPCPCFPFTISVYANANNSAEGSFATKEMDEFYLHRTNENYQVIDSVKMGFTELYSSANYNKIFRFSSETFSGITDIRPYIFIIKNTMLNTADTISTITYNEVLKSVLCNVCTNCDDEYIDCVVFENINFDLNCEVQNKAEISLIRRPN